MAFAQDVLMRIVNVHWGGGVFVAVSGNEIFYLGGEKWENLGPLDFDQDEDGMFIGDASDCSYASVYDGEGNKRPVFVLAGGGSRMKSKGIIMASRDGKNWSRVFSYGTDSESYERATIFAVVWDEAAKKFYAAGHQTDNFADPVAEYRWMAETDLLFASSDGFNWAETGRHERKVESHGGAAFPPYPEYTVGLLDAHCSKMVLDLNGNGTPDGFYGYDKDTEILIKTSKPIVVDYNFGSIGYSSSPSLVVTFSGEGTPPDYPSDPGLSSSCVATAGGKWVVAGNGAAILVSTEGGMEWQRLDPPGRVFSMTGGVIS